MWRCVLTSTAAECAELITNRRLDAVPVRAAHKAGTVQDRTAGCRQTMPQLLLKVHGGGAQ
jgi:hypothetical protein